MAGSDQSDAQPAELEALDESVLAGGVDGLHPGALDQRRPLRPAGIIRRLRARHGDNAAGVRRQLDDLRHEDAALAARGRVVLVDRRDDGLAVRCDQRGFEVAAAAVIAAMSGRTTAGAVTAPVTCPLAESRTTACRGRTYRLIVT
jgi:hypothetical protein